MAPVGILAMGSGLEARRVRTDSNVGNIPLDRGRELVTAHAFVDTDEARLDEAEIKEQLAALARAGSAVIVATESFGVDDPSNEQFVMSIGEAAGIAAAWADQQGIAANQVDWAALPEGVRSYVSV